jgi:hypothetical protein
VISEKVALELFWVIYLKDDRAFFLNRVLTVLRRLTALHQAELL